jgi:hypothetical protein
MIANVMLELRSQSATTKQLSPGLNHSPLGSGMTPGGSSFWSSVMEEIWRQIKGYEGIYDISSSGRVRSYLNWKWGPVETPQRILKNFSTIHGYMVVILNKRGVKKTVTIHSMVLNAFLCQRPIGMVSCHKDNNKKNNNVENLCWDTPQSNSMNYRSQNHKLTEDDVKSIRGLRKNGETLRSIAGMYNVHSSQIWKISKGIQWKWL